MTGPTSPEPRAHAPGTATPETAALQQQVLAELDFGDDEDFADARRGFIATVPDGRVDNRKGQPVWSMAPYAFLDDPQSPPTVNPSLWRLARLNREHGLYKVTDRVYQVRGLDIANISFIEGDTGVIVIDPLTFVESAAASLALYRAHRGDRPVTAVIYTHSHADHYGGALGVVSLEDAASGRVPVIAPAGFMQAAVSENVLAGVPMRRRALFQFGNNLAPGAHSHVDSGLGKGIGRGTPSLVPPNVHIAQRRERHVVDGVEIVFQLTPDSEAPSEMHFFFPQLRALNLAENGTRMMHNLCPLRGAQTRDALAWSKYLDEALAEFAPQADVAFAQHHWPVWGTENLSRFLAEQRDMYRFLHDQSLRLMSQGATPREVAEQLMMPNPLAKRWHARGYYGAVGHNVKSVYTKYLGWYDGNPASLSPLPPVAGGRKYVEYMGGADAVLAKARRDFERGEYRWVVQVLDHLVFADPSNRAARELAADAMEQLGFQAESSTWRNAYLLGARELREGVRRIPTGGASGLAANVVPVLPTEMFFDYLAIRIDGIAAQALSLRFDWVVPPDAGEGEPERWQLTLVNGVLNHRRGAHPAGTAHATLTMSRAVLTQALAAGQGLKGAIDGGACEIAGDRAAVAQWMAVTEDFDPNFNVVEP